MLVPDIVTTLVSRRPVWSKIIRNKAWSIVGSEGLGEPLGICQKSEKACGSVPPAVNDFTVSSLLLSKNVESAGMFSRIEIRFWLAERMLCGRIRVDYVPLCRSNKRGFCGGGVKRRAPKATLL